MSNRQKIGQDLLITKVLAENVRERMNDRFPLGPEYRSVNAQLDKVAAMSGVSKRTLKEILEQTRATRITNVEKLARAFNRHWLDLLKE